MKKRTRILFTSILVVLFAVTSYLIKDFTEMYKLYGEDLFRQSDYEETEHFLTLYSEQINGILTQVNHKLADGSKGERVPRGFNNLAYQVTVGDMVFTNVTKQEETGCFTPNLYSYYLSLIHIWKSERDCRLLPAP